jgi:transcription elongation factor GreB
MEQKNYITIAGFEILKQELQDILTKERPVLVQTINWAASNGDRSENADYIYGKRRLREIDKRIHILTKRVENAEVVDTRIHKGSQMIFFGAVVTILRNDVDESTVRIVGQDEIDPSKNDISWTSPLAKALLRKQVGDIFMIKLPSGEDTIEVLTVIY